MERLLRPRTVALIGASDSSPNAGALRMIASGIKVYPVNPSRATVYGVKAYPSIEVVPEPVDAVMSLVALGQAAHIADACSAANAGGLILFASGPISIQEQLSLAASNLAIMGPNSNGFINVHEDIYLAGTPPLEIEPGPVAFVTHSGGLHAAAANGLSARGIGMSLLVSCGNELSLDMVDYIDFLITDENTKVIALVIEQIRRPGAFFAAAARAHAAGKPIVALKIGQSERGQAIARSHTGAIAGEPWVYEAAFRQNGIASAYDLPDLLDIAAAFAQIPPNRRLPITNLAIVSTSGGMAQLASDMAAKEGMELAAFADAAEPLSQIMGEAGSPPDHIVPNPFDTGGAIASRPELLSRTLDTFAACGADALLFVWLLDEGAGEPGQEILGTLADFSQRSRIPVMLCSVEDGELGKWTRMAPLQGVAVGRGLRGAIRGLSAVGRHALQRCVDTADVGSRTAHRPTKAIPSDAGPILSFADTMVLLREFGIPIAPFLTVGPDEPLPSPLPFPGPYAVKLADVPHRTEIGAVRLGVSDTGLGAAIHALRQKGAEQNVPATIAIQPMQHFDSEAFVGAEVASALGPIVVCGVGGTMVELFGKGAARLAPFGKQEATHLIKELSPKILAGFRGARPWDTAQLAEIARNVSLLADACKDWLVSIDINPLVNTDKGFVAVDGLCVVRGEPS